MPRGGRVLVPLRAVVPECPVARLLRD